MHTHIQTHAHIHTFGVAKSMSFQLKATWDGKSFLIGLFQLNDGFFVLFCILFSSLPGPLSSFRNLPGLMVLKTEDRKQ